MNYINRSLLLLYLFLFAIQLCIAQVNWAKDGKSYYTKEDNEIIKYTLPNKEKIVLVNKDMLSLNGAQLEIKDYYFSQDQTKVLIYTNSKKVWRVQTQGDYWVLDLKTKLLQKLGDNLPDSSLQFAKFSPDGTMVAYVSKYNVYVENISSKEISQLTFDGHRKLINGTFDWAYEEEFMCRDGFQWSPDSERIAFWQIDASNIPDYNMINNVDSVYAQVIPVEYPTAGQDPSSAKIGVFSLANQSTSWLDIPGDPIQHYLPRIEWNSNTELFVQQLNRKQNESKIYNCDVVANKAELVYEEKDDTWIDVISAWENSYGLTFRHEFKWINKNEEFLWMSEQDGWRHLYRIDKNGKAKLITKGDFDVMNVLAVDERSNFVYFHATPENATQKYLYRTKLDGSGKIESLTPSIFEGTNNYSVSPTGQYATHRFENHSTKPVSEFIELPNHRSLNESDDLSKKVINSEKNNPIEFFKVRIEDGTEMDGWIIKPINFDPEKKYPVVFYVYTEPWGANVKDVYNVGRNRLYKGNMAEDGYIYISIDNRGTPVPKGREWRKSIYRKIGRLNISDQAKAANEILKWNFVDRDRIAVWGWSGGGSATLNLLFQYPEIYKTGIAVAAVGNQLTYDNIYQERYMGLPQENLSDFVDGSPITHAQNLEGNLLYIHGTGDDNVHYNNAEMLINELVKHKKQFQFMAYPNRSHSISEGEGTFDHLSTLFTNYLKTYCPPGPK